MQIPHSSDDSSPQQAPAPGSRRANVATLLVSLLISLLVIEIGYRLAAGVPVLRLANWRTDRVITLNLGELKGIADPVLGWINRPWNKHEDGYSTIDYGVRQNFDETTIRTGAVLAVGDSFTEGWQVKDYESWPAYLEKLANVPVVNAGTGGYGVDQVVLRAEQMLPIVKPKILIVGVYEVEIVRVGYSVYGAPKPYFTIENGGLRYHPPKLVEPHEHSGLLWSIAYPVREILGYSAALDFVMARLRPNFWHGSEGDDLYNKIDINEAAVTCALLQRLKAQADKDTIKMMVFLQYEASLIVASDWVSPNPRLVAACSQAAGIRVVDQFASLREIVRGNPKSISDYYWDHGVVFGHMTAKGNAHAASLLAPALSDWLPGIPGWTPRSHASPLYPTTPDGAAAQQP